MPISRQQEVKVQNWLRNHAPINSCTFCGINNWVVGDIIAPTVTFQGENLDISGDSRPMVQIICGNCAKIELFDASMIGLI
ncbi:hypothetical protein [Rhodohalobacter barkolensis]|uniref:Uncharacterized protein n=1 Tax=Rhodohalobacter barkolensis TaxID=2053187 RepID=A0A2N0VM63_9BACT|nr:hypothetical protein [Rhodohalobacter barkolensis]PKD45280.1 hypothetical protein CWD77_07510 [Rhodohalobacter barkolensis]